MPSVCPRPCSRLATAAVFLSVGVVQFIVGIILLKSEYVYLLAGPDFWTSSCNVAVGCLLGVSASIWRTSRKRESKKHTTRRRLLLALVASALLMNATTLVILVLGEGNALLSIRLESHGTLAGELLAYAYVTSVCCPVVCIVISIVSMSGSCFSVSGKDSLQRRFSLGSFKKRKSESLQWVYADENRNLPRSKPQDSISSSEESENDSEDVVVMRQKHSSSIEELQSVLSRMAHGNRDSILRDSALMLRQLDLRRQHRISSLNQDGSYMGPSLLRMKEFSASERSTRAASSNELDDSGFMKVSNPERYSSELDESSRFAPDGPKLASYSGSGEPDVEYRNPYSRKYAESRDPSQPREIIYSPHHKNYGERQMTRPKMPERESSLPPYMHDYSVNGDVIFSHKAFKPTPEIEYSQICASEEHPDRERHNESLDDEILTNEVKRRHYVIGKTKQGPHYETTKTKERSHKITETEEAPQYATSKRKKGSHCEANKTEKGSRHETSKAIERSHYETNKKKEGLRYEASETNEGSRYEASESNEGSRYETSKAKEGSRYETSKTKEGSRYETSKTKEGSRYETSKTKEGSRYETSKPKERSPDVNNCFSPEGSEFSEDSILDSSRASPWAGEMISISFKNPSVARLSDKLIPVASPIIPTHQEFDLPKMSDDSGIFSIQSTSFSSDVANQNELNGKYRKVSSFRENVKGCKEPSQEFPKAGPQGIKKYDLSRVVTMDSISEEPNVDSNGPEPKSSQCSGPETPKLSRESRRVSLPSMFSDSDETHRHHEDSEGNYSPRRKRSLSTKALRKLLSVAHTSNQMDFSDQVVDNDSLIGLSEEELIARQLRTRSIRKTVQKRIKDEMTV